jgi:uncharacterized membrane protein YqhA
VDLNKLFLFRYLCILPVAVSLLGALLMFVIGTVKTLDAFSIFFTYSLAAGPGDSSAAYEATVLLIRSVDAFLIGLFLIVFAYSVYELFLIGVATDRHDRPFPWLKMEGLDELKTALAQLVVVILFVLFLDKVMASEKTGLILEDLVLPVAILCLAAAKRMLRRQ